ncbi:MAG: glycosyltransferase family 4 protein [Chloroflexi bacterium]|nr:glycosyltransferase family 4 protein [Chloroflexota bacterium]
MADPPAPGPGARPDRGRPSAVRRAIRRAAAILPAARRDAARRAVRATGDFVAGRPPASWRVAKGEPLLDPAWAAAAQEALAGGRPDDALAIADRVLAAHPRLVAALEVRQVALFRLGEPTASLAALRAVRAIADRPERARLEERILAMLRESDPGWLPRIPGPPEPLVAADPGRVLHLLKESVPDRQSGYTMRSQYIARAQRAAGLDPVVVTALGFPRSTTGRPAPPTETVDGIRFHRLDLGPAYPADAAPDRYLEDYAWLAAGVVRTERPAVIHASSGIRGYDAALVGLALRERHGVPLVYDVRSFFETSWSRREDAAAAELASRREAADGRVMAAADAVVTIAEAMHDDIVARGIAAEKVFVVPNGVDAAWFAPRPPDPALRARLGLRGFVFGYVSNLDHPRENQELLVDAAVRLRARGRLATCLIVGDGTRRAELEEHARRAGARGAVVFAGAVPHADVLDYYAILDAFVVPRRDERASRFVTPLKPFEAMAMARPLVVSDLPALREIAAPDERGLAFPPGDVDGLVAALERLVAAPDLGRAIGEAGRAWVVRERAWAADVPRLDAAYAFARERRGVAG